MKRPSRRDRGLGSWGIYAHSEAMTRFLLANLDRYTVDGLHKACAAAFPGRHTPSRASVGYFVQGRRRGISPPARRPCTIAVHPQLARFIRDRIGGTTVRGLVEACRAEFPEIAVSRSAMGGSCMRSGMLLPRWVRRV